MTAALYLALAYVRFHRWQTAALVLALALIQTIPLGTRIVLNASEEALGARAEATPLVIGARGAATDLILNALYFTDSRPPTVPQSASDAVWDSGLAAAIPLHVRFRAEGLPVVGTTLDYFGFRGLDLAAGRDLGVIGEAVLGADAAERLGLGPGDTLVTDPETLFDLTGAYPLELSVVGVLEPAGTPDDGVVFVDVKTAWIIEGVGHGHDDVAEGAVLAAAGGGANVVASPGVRQFQRITPENIESFHFHGDTAQYPLSAVIAVPNDPRAGTILQGRYLERDDPLQVVTPGQVVGRLLGTLFRIGRLLDAAGAMGGLAALVAIAVAICLSLELRRGEIDTMFRLGARRLTMARMLAAQVALILVLSGALAATFLLPLSYHAETLAVTLVSARP
jgi:putative ABC transport system permease protein